MIHNMETTEISPQGVIEELAEQNKVLSLNNAVLQTYVKQLEAAMTPTAETTPPPPEAFSAEG